MEETESHLASRAEFWREEREVWREEWRRKRRERREKEKSGERGRGRRRKMERIRKRKRREADWREVRRWTGVAPLINGSESVARMRWWMMAMEREKMMK